MIIDTYIMKMQSAVVCVHKYALFSVTVATSNVQLEAIHDQILLQKLPSNMS